jgi:glycosyl transferase family 87
LELPRLSGRESLARFAKLAALLAAFLSIALPTTASAAVASSSTSARSATDPNVPVLVTSQHTSPAGYRLTAAEVEKIAARAPKIRAEVRRHPKAQPYEYTKGPGRWQVSWFSSGANQKELAQVYVDDASGRVTEAWTGFQVAWTMARGYPGAFGKRVNAWYVWIPLCLLFVVPFLPWRRRPTLLHLDLAVLLAFSISLAFFNHGQIGISVPLPYPFLLYLLARMLLLGFGRGRPREPLRLLVPATWLAIATVFLVGFRIGLNVTNSNVIDVGYAGVIGADKLLHDKPLYGGWPHDNASGDTYGPVNYYAYIPFRAVFGWSGSWDGLPAAHAAAIAFDLLTLVGLFFLGRRIRGPTTGIVLSYAWAAYPFTLYALCSNSNDGLVALLIVLALLLVGSAPARGAAAALAGMAKFAPFVLAPLLARGTGPWPRKRSLAGFAVAFLVTVAVVIVPVLSEHDFHAFWHDTVRAQFDRTSPFSIWGLWGSLGLEQHLVQALTVALGVAVAFVPRKRTLVEVCALGAAVLIAFQLGLTHWFYLYIPWFFGLAMLALIGSHPRAAPAPPPTTTTAEPQPALARTG